MDVRRLEDVPWLAGATEDERRRVAEAALERSYPAGREMIRQGEMTDAFYVILEGSADVVRDDTVINRLSEGEFFGEMGALDAGPGYSLARNASLVVVDELTAAVIPGDRFAELLREMPWFREQIYATMSRRES